MSAFLQRERHGAVLMVRMNSPETRNALTTPEQFQELVDLCAELRQDHSVKAVVLTGNGKAFCSGGNIKDIITIATVFRRFRWHSMSWMFPSLPRLMVLRLGQVWILPVCAIFASRAIPPCLQKALSS